MSDREKGSHASVRLSKAVQRKIELILEQGRRPPDVYLQGVEIMLAKYRRARKADNLVRQVADLLAREDVTVGEFRAALDRYSPCEQEGNQRAAPS